ncbi:MFS transporter [Sporothrix brasiliensis 5110]|uniref:MFS transporter n=1 Tax=Sporothrix brasiliensis 5110 TaxID=1398154 RepID=A0A0C2FJM2_9PEZI|nr:MFS transporter [Sporothrix brasiliensis 5110]KIH91228.1 MFS transporter [Sporothrix brasiliensis 5110]
MSSTQTQTKQGDVLPLETLEVADRRLQDDGHGTTTTTTATAPARMSRSTQIKILSAGFSFFVAGINDGSIGALFPYILQDYGITTAIASSVYGANFVGWFVAALSNTHLCQHLSLGAMLLLGAALQTLAHALRPWQPPYALFAASFVLSSLGQAYQDTHGNTFAAGVRPAAHRWLALIHAMYAAGLFCGPFASTAVASSAVASSASSRWSLFYYVPLGLGVLNVGLVAYAFRDVLAVKTRSQPAAADTAVDASPGSDRRARDLVQTALRSKNVWLLSLFFFFFLGAGVTASGWMVEYLVVVRHGDIARMGFVQAGFSGGNLLGRLLLAEPTHRLGTRPMICIYTLLAIGLQLLFWLVPNIIVASISVCLLGFVMGPYFATTTAQGMSIGSRLFAPEIHPTALAFVFVIAQIGGCLFPIITGLVASRVGVHILQPMLCALLVATAVSWLLVPRPKESGHALHEE